LGANKYTIDNVESEVKIESVFYFLDQIIKNEKNKEMRFL
jgi:hypothetical protein